MLRTKINDSFSLSAFMLTKIHEANLIFSHFLPVFKAFCSKCQSPWDRSNQQWIWKRHKYTEGTLKFIEYD